jgi:hypothetical protein
MIDEYLVWRWRSLLKAPHHARFKGWVKRSDRLEATAAMLRVNGVKSKQPGD